MDNVRYIEERNAAAMAAAGRAADHGSSNRGWRASLPEADVGELREILQSYRGGEDLADHVRISPRGSHALLEISETGREGPFETVAWIRDGATLRVTHLVDNGPLVLGPAEIVQFPSPKASPDEADACSTPDVPGVGRGDGMSDVIEYVPRGKAVDLMAGSDDESLGSDAHASAEAMILQALIAQDVLVL